LYEGEGEGIKQAFRCYSTQFEEEYSRYWHGYVVPLRVLLLLFDYHEIRIINGILQTLLFMLVAFHIWKKKGTRYALAIGTAYVLMMPLALTYCLQYSWIYYISFLAVYFYAKYQDYWDVENRYLYLFLITGIAAIYFDLMTYPLLTWGLVTVWMILLQKEATTAFVHVKQVILSAIAWIIGYAMMWIGKWTVGSLILRENLFAKAISEAFMWTVDETGTLSWIDRIKSIYLNWNTFAYKIYLMVLVAWVLYWIGQGLFVKRKRSLKAPALLLTLCSSLVWCFVMASHVIMHHIFTHRMFIVSIAAFIGIILLSTEKTEDYEYSPMYRIKYVVATLAMAVLGVCFMLQIKDDFQRHNGALSFTQTELTDTAVMAFVPEYQDIKSVNIGVAAPECTTGYCDIKVFDKEAVVAEAMLPLNTLGEDTFHTLAVDWHLKKDYLYVMTVQPVDNDGKVDIFLTWDGITELPELGGVTLGSENTYGQMLAGITYRCILTENAMRILYSITFFGLCSMIVYSVWSTAGLVKEKNEKRDNENEEQHIENPMDPLLSDSSVTSDIDEPDEDKPNVAAG